MSYYYSVVPEAGGSDTAHGPYDTPEKVILAGIADAKSRGYTNNDGKYWMTVTTDSGAIYAQRLYRANNGYSSYTPSEVWKFHYELIQMDEGRYGVWGVGQDYETEAAAKEAAAAQIRLNQLIAYKLIIYKDSPKFGKVGISSQEHLPEGWGKPPAPDAIFYFRIRTDKRGFENFVSDNFTTRKSCEDAAFKKGNFYRYTLDPSTKPGEPSQYLYPRGWIDIFEANGTEKKLETYTWGDVTDMPGEKPMDERGDGAGLLEGQDWQMWAAIATVVMVIIMMAVFMKSKGAASG